MEKNKESSVNSYNFNMVEPKIKKFWEKEKIYKFQPGKGNIFSIDTPPPTVSGSMHIGHALSYSQQDFIARYKRMNGPIFYPFGTDDNGLPTERLIEKINKIKSKDMSREEFIQLCIKTLKEITPDFIDEWKRVGISADYSIYYSTIDDNSRKISQKSFIDLYKSNQIYKKKFPTIWCPECQTSIAQAELEDKEMQGEFSTIEFGRGEHSILISTTRPELIPACIAIFVNPEDKRYKKLIGKNVEVPLVNRMVPIISDSSANTEKGTGALMVCSYGDKFDVEAINRHKLEPIELINQKGIMVNGPYAGQKIRESRKKILEDLNEKKLIKEKKLISHIVNTHDRCSTPIEFISTSQWFIKIIDKREILLNQGKKIKWHPEFMHKRYENWVNGLEWDWSISRDRHFGVPIPAWECGICKEIILPNESELPIDPINTKKECKKCNHLAEPEKMVLDTWATSSLSPQIASSLVKGKVKIPYSLRPQAHDIIRTWAFYTIVKSYLHDKQIPWTDTFISGFVTLSGEKMSKSKGNTISPKEVVEKFGSDALRFWAASSKLGEDLDYQEQDLIAGKKTINKLWNAYKFTFMNLKDHNPKEKPKKLEEIDTLFLEELNSLIKFCSESFENYEYSKAKSEIEHFFWKSFCDNYLEIVKKRIYNESGDSKSSAQYTLYRALLTILKLFSPIIPFITEEIYQESYRKFEGDKSIHLSKWPEFKNTENSHKFEKFCEILSKIRQVKTNEKKSMNSEIILYLSKEDNGSLGKTIKDLKDVTNAKEIKESDFKVEFT